VSTGHDEAAAEPSAMPQVFADPRIAELYRWSRGGVAAREFEQRFLEQLRALLGADGAAVWFDPGGEALYLRHKRKFPASDLQRDIADWQLHGRLLRWVADGNHPRLVEPGWTQDDIANPTPHELLVAGAQVAGTHRIVLEVLREPGSADAPRNAAADLELVAAAAEFAADHVRAERIIEGRRAHGVRKLQQEFTQQLHASLDPQRVAFVAANDGARALGCDRVTVLLRRRRKARVAAVSGQTEPNRRANAVSLMESFATRVLRSGEAVVSSPSAKKCPAALEGSLKAHTTAAGCTTLFAVPLPAADNAQTPLGVLLVEQFDDKLPVESLAEGVQFVAAQTAVALRNATAHDQILFRSWRGRIGRMLAESVRLRRIVALLVLSAIAVTLYVVPWQLRMKGQGTLRAAERRGVFAAESGTVRQVLVMHGDRVHAGQTLVVMENHELSVRLQQAAEQLASVREQLKIKEVERSDRQLSTLRQIQLDGEIAELTERDTYLRQQQALLEKRIEQLTLTAPIDGVVATWNPEQQLVNRPVLAGNLLIQMVDPDGPWKLELQVPDVDAGYVQRAWAERDPHGRGLPVDYILATHPEKQYRGWLVDVAPRTENAGKEPVVYMTVEPDPADPPPPRDGADVRGKIHCGERPLGYVLLREVIEFVQSRVLF
jgi:hypothetical protein